MELPSRKRCGAPRCTPSTAPREGDWSKALGALAIQVDEATSRKLDKIRGPRGTHFHTWTELGKHLDSMTECAQELRGLGL